MEAGDSTLRVPVTKSAIDLGCGQPQELVRWLLIDVGGQLIASVAHQFEYLVLDGQQRLTALYHAFHGRGPYVYALKHGYGEDSADLDLDESIVSVSRDEWDRKYKGYARQRQHGLVPLYSLTTASDFYAWRDAMVETAQRDEREDLRHALTKLYRTVLHEAHRYQFPVVQLQKRLAPAAIARIFDRVNRTGLRLGAFDLMVAQLYEPEWNLRTKWDEARYGSALMDRFFADDGLPALQVLALKYKEDVREAAVLSLPKRLVHEQWSRGVRGRSGEHFCVRSCVTVRETS